MPKPESMLKAKIRSSYFKILTIAKDIYIDSMNEAMKSGR